MEQFSLYLFRSSVWLTAFAIVFLLFLRNERFFLLNRIYLIAGILTALIFPLISIRYTVYLPALPAQSISGNVIGSNENIRESLVSGFSVGMILLYISGALFVTFLIIKQSRSVFKSVRSAEVVPGHSVKLIRSNKYESSFSFFSYVFVNPSVTDVEAREILNHELVHVRQKHWFDLMLAELLCIIQWFNPMIWIYVRLIRQNHEYLADEGALQRTSDPLVYRATLLNQIVGSPVCLANSFSCSLNKKRFDMMKNIKSSPYRKLKMLLVLPVFAFILYSFAEPDYRYTIDSKTLFSENAQSGINRNNVADIISIENAVTPQESEKKVSNASTPNTPQKATKSKADPVAPPPPARLTSTSPSPDLPTSPTPLSSASGAFKISNQDGKKPLIIVDGNVTDDISSIDQNSIMSIYVLKSTEATGKYGEKAKDGVVEITLKKGVTGDPSGSNTEVRVIGYGNQKPDTSHSEIRVVRYGNQITDPSQMFVKIRNNGQNNTDSPPLVIIDGIEKGTDLSNVAQEDIQSMTVLKNESATKLYGEKGKNGVIVITTKKKLY